LWSWPDSFAIPLCLVIAETAWFSLLVNAMINSGTGPHIDLPFLAFALPTLAAVGLGAAIGARQWTRWRHIITIGIVGSVGSVGAAFTAATVSQLSEPSASWLLVATHPWSVQGHGAAIAASSGWLVGVATWGRGLWIAVDPPTFRPTVWSISLAALLFVGVFAGRSRSHSPQFLSATSSAGWLLFLWFPFAAATAALIRQRELEREVLNRTRSRPSGVWVAILIVPMAAVALLALLIAGAIGPAGPALVRAAVATVHGIADAAGWLWRLIPGTSEPKEYRRPPTPNGQTETISPPRGAGHIDSLPGWAQIVLLVLAVCVLLAGLIWFLRNEPLRGSRAAKTADLPVVVVEEERDSLFSWHHLATQLWTAIRALLRRLLWWRNQRVDPTVATDSAGPHQRLETETIRQAYRRVLRAARTAGHGRGLSETTRELRARLTRAELAPVGALEELTDFYDQVRYADVDLDDPASTEALRHADSITSTLTGRPG
jgi:hypothetical protein